MRDELKEARWQGIGYFSSVVSPYYPNYEPPSYHGGLAFY
jgi:hypothetical protein